MPKRVSLSDKPLTANEVRELLETILTFQAVLFAMARNAHRCLRGTKALNEPPVNWEDIDAASGTLLPIIQAVLPQIRLIEGDSGEVDPSSWN
jgi:hypothetical protein